MTQLDLDLPQLSLARYLELLKRRRWQVLPVSIAGLLIGALVAFLVPRNYAVRTVLQYKGSLLEDPQVLMDDPVGRIFESAQILIPGLVPEVLDDLGWPEAKVSDTTARVQFVEGVRSRVLVFDENAGRGRVFANLTIRYEDPDLERAVEFANALREKFIARERGRIGDGARADLERIADQIRQATAAKDQATADLQLHMERYKINPEGQQFFRANEFRGGARIGRVSEQLYDLSEEISAVSAALVESETRVKNLQAQLDSGSVPMLLLRRIDPNQEELDPELVRKVQSLAKAKRKLQNISPQHREHPATLQQVQELEAEVGEVASPLGPRWVQVPNPAFVLLEQNLAAAQADVLAQAEIQRQKLERQEDLQDELDRLPDVYRRYEDLLDAVVAANDEVKFLRGDEREMQRRYQQLTAEDNIDTISRAFPQASVTSPSLLVIALLGCGIGLASAIGLVLLLDFMQTTFKTVDDVERGLTVPVLGGMAHMTTIEERRAESGRRRRVALIATALLIMVLMVVTIYYVAPTRLPGAVTSALDVLLGTG